MTNIRFGRAAARGLLLSASVSSASIARADTDPTPPTISPPTIRSTVDDNGVNLGTGAFEMTTTDVSIGSPGGGGLAHARVWAGNGWRHGFVMTLTASGTRATVSVGGRSSTFRLFSGVYQSNQGDGARLTATTEEYTYTAPDGTIVIFNRAYDGDFYYGAVSALGTSVTFPSGERIKLTYKTQRVGAMNMARLQSINSSNGYQLKYSYSGDFYTISEVTGINNAIDFCNPAADVCGGLTQSWPSVRYAVTAAGPNLQESVTDALDRVRRYTIDSSSRLIGIRRPSSSLDDIVIGYDDNGRVTSVTNKNNNATWTYVWRRTSPDSPLTATITDPLSHQRITTADIETVVLLTDKDALDRTTTYQYDSMGRLTAVVPPTGTIVSGTPTAGYTKYDYDSGGRLLTTTVVSRTPGTPANIVTSATYPPTCSNLLTCKKPLTTTDARGKVTDYVYDPATGFPTSITQPAPSPGAVRPQTRFAYTALTAYYKQASGGSPGAAATPIYKLTTVSACATTSSCTGSADEVRTTIGYGPQTTGVGNNLLPVTASSGAGDGSLTTTTTSVYDMTGNLYTVDGPLAGTADIVRYRFDAVHQLTGVVSPDPDGGGALKNRAIRYTYDPDGRPTLIEQGRVESQSDADWPGFVTLSQAARFYDLLGRLAESDTPGTTLAQRRITHYGYDLANRQVCVADRMKFYGTLDPVPADPCIVYPAGAYGEDRITRYDYDAADQLTSVTTAFGTAQQRVDRTLSYTGNGLLQTVKDARNNLTTYEYDGIDRLTKLRYPRPTTPNTSSTTDYEKFTYDAASNVTQSRRRDESLIEFGYDDLDRLTAKNLPGSEPDVSYGYDNLGRMIATASSVASLGFDYDQLGRITRATSPQGNTDHQYDLADRRTRLTWPDGFYVTYNYLLTGEMTAIRESGATAGIRVLATFAYDDLGRRTTLTRGNGTVTRYGYDAGSRLTSLEQDLAGTVADQDQTLGYNPSGQIVSDARSNDAYTYGDAYNSKRDYAVNGLDQYVTAGSAVPGYDAKGNLNGLRGNTYGYSSENLLVTATGTSGLRYDPALRLYQIGGAATTRFGYDGSDMIGEYDGSNALQRRTVFGPGGDEPLLWYEGSGTTDRRWLHADERGSVTAISNASGGAIAIDSYDDYGMPAKGNIGRFQYTGQMWLAETGGPPDGIYHYKARAYSPRLGRFLQTDPIGTQGGLNLYNYAISDPVNRSDPSGTDGALPLSDLRVTGLPEGSGFEGHDFSLFNFELTFGGPGSVGAGVSDGAPDDRSDIIVTGKRNKPLKLQSQPLSIGVLSLQVASAPQVPSDPKSAVTGVPDDPCLSAGDAPGPEVFAARGQAVMDAASKLTDNGGGFLIDAFNFPEFRRGASLDAQAFGGSRAYGNYAYGVYLAASGHGLGFALWGANAYAYYSKARYTSTGMPMDKTYSSLPAVNVANIKRGYNDQKSGTICKKPRK